MFLGCRDISTNCGKPFRGVYGHFRTPLNSPLAHGVIDLIALAAADGDGVEELEGTQTHTRDGHQRAAEAQEDSLGVVESHAEVMTHRDHQRIGAAAQAPVT